MELRGTITSGRLVLDEGGTLPDGTRVTVLVRGAGRKKTSKPDALANLPKLAVRTGRDDLAEKHDSRCC